MGEDYTKGLEFDPSAMETFDAERAHFAELLSKYGFSPALIKQLLNIYGPMKYTYDPEGSRSFFSDIGLIERAVSDGTSEVVISEKTIESRAARLRGIVTPGTEREVAYAWMVGHELGHAVQMAYGMLYARTEEEVAASRQMINPRPADFIEAQRELYGEFFDKAVRIENERECEGFAKLVLASELEAQGIEPKEEVFEKAYEEAKRIAAAVDETASLADDPFLVHPIGYANPLPLDELLERFK